MTSTLDRPSGNWYQGLDGVRAIAVILVFSVHSIGFRTRFVGWTGVNIFFVLSGFLITGILYDNRDEPFRFRNFYIRRALRIFPLFYFAWLIILVAGIFLRAHWEPIQFLWPLYMGNYVRFLVGDMRLDHIATMRPPFLPLEIGHFWSLAVEEQFYLLWPLVVFYVRERKRLIRICVAAVILVPVLRVVLWATVSKNLLSILLLYMLTPTQCDAFLLGGLLALWLRGAEKDRLLRNAGKILALSFTLLTASYLLNNGLHLRDLSNSSGWMSTYGFTLLDFSAAGLILCALRPGTLAFRLTTWAPLRIVGKYSYGVYVYHVMMLGFLQYYVWPANHNWPPRFYLIHAVVCEIGYFLIVLAVSACSYHFVELPFLNLKDRFTMRHKNPGVETS